MSAPPFLNSEYAKALSNEIEHVKKLNWNNHKLVVYIDTVEKEETKNILSNIEKAGIECKMLNLVSFGGDIHVQLDGKLKLVIERKAGMDFASSIADGRLHGQLNKLKRLPLLAKNVFLLMEKKSFEKSRMTIGVERYEGATSDIQIKYGFQILYSSGIESTLYMLLKFIKKIHSELPLHLGEIRPFPSFDDFRSSFQDTVQLIESFSREIVPNNQLGLRSTCWKLSEADMVELKTHPVEKPSKLTCEKAFIYMLCAAQFSLRQALTLAPHFNSMKHLIDYLDETDPQEVVNTLGWLPMVTLSKEVNFKHKENIESSSSSSSTSEEETFGQAAVLKLYRVLLDRNVEVKRYTKAQMQKFETTGKRPNFRTKKKDQNQKELQEEEEEVVEIKVKKRPPPPKKKRKEEQVDEDGDLFF